MDRLWIEYQTADPERRREIEELLLHLAVRRLHMALGNERIVLEPPHPSLLATGAYLLGSVSYPGLGPSAFRVRHGDLLRHMFVLGPTGTGKSTFILGLLVQLVADRQPFMVFDFKRNYRCLLAQDDATRVVVLTVGRNLSPVGLNALRPPSHVDRASWAEALTDVISAAYLLLQDARNVLKEALFQTYRAQESRATLRHTYDLLVSELLPCRVP